MFEGQFGQSLTEVLQQRFGDSINLTGAENEAWDSVEVAWSGWRLLQARAEHFLPYDHIYHLLSMEAWFGVYLPVDLEPYTVHGLPDQSTPLDVASLLSLYSELQLVGNVLGLPVEGAQAQALANRYQSEDSEAETFAQLIIGTEHGLRTAQPLWVVK